MSTSRLYELVYILAPDASEEVAADIAGQVSDIVSRYEGAIEGTEDWGRRRLAYEIEGHNDGLYVLYRIQGAGELVKEVDRRLRVLDPVIRHLVIRVDEALKVADHTKTQRVARTRRRRVARGLPPDPPPPAESPTPAASEASTSPSTPAPAEASTSATASEAGPSAPADAGDTTSDDAGEGPRQEEG